MALDLSGWTEDDILADISALGYDGREEAVAKLAERLATLWEARQLNLSRIDELRCEIQRVREAAPHSTPEKEPS